MMNHQLSCSLLSFRNYESFRAYLETFLEELNSVMEYFMIPRLITDLEESTEQKVIWVNDAVNVEQYKEIATPLFLGMHPTTRSPYLLNYAASEDNMKLNFEISVIWNILKEWLQKEKLEIDYNSINEQIAGNYIMKFNKEYEMVYINNFDKELDRFFSFPTKIETHKDLTMERLIKHTQTYETLKMIIENMQASGCLQYNYNQPNMTIKMCFGANSSFKGFYLIFRSNMLYSFRAHDLATDFAMVLTPMPKKKDSLDDADPNDNLDAISMSNISKLESLGLQASRQPTLLGKNVSRFHPQRDQLISKPSSVMLSKESSIMIGNENARENMNSNTIQFRRRDHKLPVHMLNKGRIGELNQEISNQNLNGSGVGGYRSRFKVPNNTFMMPLSRNDSYLSPEANQILEDMSVKYSISKEYMGGQRVGFSLF